jgi:hypothetical protein
LVQKICCLDGVGERERGGGILSFKNIFLKKFFDKTMFFSTLEFQLKMLFFLTIDILSKNSELYCRNKYFYIVELSGGRMLIFRQLNQ